MMEVIGNFSVKRKRNLDPIDISEIIVANNFYILLKLKKKKNEWKDELALLTLRNIFEYGKLEGKNQKTQNVKDGDLRRADPSGRCQGNWLKSANNTSRRYNMSKFFPCNRHST